MSRCEWIRARCPLRGGAKSLPQDADTIRTHPPKLNDIAKEDVRQQTAKPMQSIPRSGMADLQYASCLDNSNHPEADRALPSIWTLFCCQSAQKIVRYRSSLVWLCTALMASWPCTRTVRGRTRRSANESRTGAAGRGGPKTTL